jgi:tetratricopeptide (TPR) repeat protein
LLCGVAGIALVWFKLGLIDMQWDARLIALAGGWMLAALILPPLRFSAASQMAAGIALGVHLLGAGGISMPVISVTLLLLWLGPAAPVAAPATAAGALPPAGRRAAVAACLVLGALIPACLLTAVIPSTLSNLYTNAAISVMAQRGDASAARRLLQQAIQADGDNPQPYVFMAQLEHDQARLRGDPRGANVETAIAYLRDAVRRDPENPKTYWLKAQWELEQFERIRDRRVIDEAVRSAEAAAARDPQNVVILATLARVYSSAERHADARETAQRGLALDDLNRELGHYDRLLDEPTRSRLSDLTADR